MATLSSSLSKENHATMAQMTTESMVQLVNAECIDSVACLGRELRRRRIRLLAAHAT
jgi:hypothetical protein